MLAALAPASFAAPATAAHQAMGGICSSLGTAAGDSAPQLPARDSMTPLHCVFCTGVAPLLFVPPQPWLVALLDAPSAVMPPQRDVTRPVDTVAFYPLSARAPPRAA